jgi:hypothetical protein
MRGQAIEYLDGDKGGVERGADSEGAVEIRRRVAMRMAVVVIVVIVSGHRMSVPRVTKEDQGSAAGESSGGASLASDRRPGSGKLQNALPFSFVPPC